MTVVEGEEWCCEGCYNENGTQCWKCDVLMFKDIEDEKASSDILDYYYENCDDGDCCATCMAEIVEEHKEEQEEEEKFKVEEDEEVRTIYVTRPLDGCVYNMYLCDECDFMTRNDDPDCSNCDAKCCMMAKCIE
jgi:predicted choloylglycine hydrolase